MHKLEGLSGQEFTAAFEMAAIRELDERGEECVFVRTVAWEVIHPTKTTRTARSNMPQATTNTNTRYELRAKDGTPITAQSDLIPGNADLHEGDNLTLHNDGRLELEWAGGTELIWDAQEPERRYGETVFLSATGDTYLAGDLVIVEITRDQDGEEHETTRPYTQSVMGPFTQQRTPGGKRIRALELAQWIIGSDQDVLFNEITPEARDRIHTRTLEYAQVEGLTDLLDAILGTLQTE